MTVASDLGAGPAAAAVTGPAVRIRDLRMTYGDNAVLRGLDLEIGHGEVVALLGPNGAGKTTTIEILEGFRAPSGGEVEVLGVQPVRGGERWRADIGVVLQSWRDHAKWRVAELLGHLGDYYAPYSEPERPRPVAVAELLGWVGLTDRAGQRIGSLSGGQRRRLDVAIGLVGRPRLLFLDEPTAGLDPHARQEFHELVHRLADVDGVTILLTTHDLAEAEKLADRILILDGGRIVADGSAAALSREVAGHTEVRWCAGGERSVHGAPDDAAAVAFVRELLAGPGPEVTELEVRRSSLEDTYLAMVQRREQGR
ncbi:ABC transporter ATP-binding protein [Pseudonocardia pini]|uniref:ABC transporter ATP-binding protein n=1 Tax=Pseudonocardia pini TaxID=2758030 RepID=UPI0015F0C811|nr:ABC transporter ATP-binding protein [Pseudonocardia pini]